MRIAYALGAIEALRSEPVVIKSFSTSSAGTVAALAYLAPDFDRYSDELLTKLATRRFINPLRIWRIADMDYLVDEVFKLVDPQLLGQGGTEIWVSLVDSKEATV